VTPAATAAVDERENTARVCVVGPGRHFLSAMTYYTFGLVNALSRRQPTSAILIRRLIPSHFYPGRARVGAELSDLKIPSEVAVVDDVDWYWGLGLARALRLLRRRHVDVLVLEWWTGSVLHTYLVLAIATRLRGSRVVVEFHEVLDTAEAKLRPVRWYVTLVAPALFRLASGFVVHNEHDRQLLRQRYKLPDDRTAVIPFPSYDAHGPIAPRQSSNGKCRLLFFGTVRPYKGVEDLVVAFERLVEEGHDEFELTIVGETWEGWTLPDRLIEASPVRDRIGRIDRFVSDAEAGAYFSEADVVVLPYRRCSSSANLGTAMALGLPVVTTRVGGLPEATAGYGGAVLAEAGDPDSLREAIIRAVGLRGRQFTGTVTWEDAGARYGQFLDAVRQGRSIRDLLGARS
jgi:glycosyltransferase involved in cell wall biosynthesis